LIITILGMITRKVTEATGRSETNHLVKLVLP
jgi:hypothetical protein